MKEEKFDTTSFCYWLQGFFEISESKTLSSKQTQIIKDHLDLVFDKITPDRSGEVVHDLGETKSKELLLDGTRDCEENWSKVLSEAVKNSISTEEFDNKPFCETAQKFGVGKFNIKRKTVYC